MATNPELLTAVIVQLTGPRAHEWGKVEDGEYTAIEQPDPARIVAWLESHGFEQHGAMVGDVPRLAVFWLRQTDPKHLEDADSPEYYAQALDCRVVPATCCWNRTEGKIATTRTANQIRRHRSRIFGESAYARDLAYVEEPTLAARLRAYGLTR